MAKLRKFRVLGIIMILVSIIIFITASNSALQVVAGDYGLYLITYYILSLISLLLGIIFIIAG